MKAAVPCMLSASRGVSIVLTSSVGGLKAYRHTGLYIAAKHGVAGRCARSPWNSVSTRSIRVIAKMMHVLLVGLVEPIGISNAVLFLASDESRYVTDRPMTIEAGSMLK